MQGVSEVNIDGREKFGLDGSLFDIESLETGNNIKYWNNDQRSTSSEQVEETFERKMNEVVIENQKQHAFGSLTLPAIRDIKDRVLGIKKAGSQSLVSVYKSEWTIEDLQMGT